MAIQTINIGTNPNDGTGDDLRTAFDKVNDNFTELLAVGGETNTASNLGIGSQILKGKSGLDFQFRTLRNTDGKLSIAYSGSDNEVVINTVASAIADNDFGAIQVDNGDTITASSSGQLVGIKKGNTNISVTKSGNDVLISGNFNLVNDTNPQLADDLELLNNAIIGPGSLSSITSITTDVLNANTVTVTNGTTLNGTLTANSLVTMAQGLTVSNGISGNLTGGFEGTITDTVDLNGQVLTGNGRLVIDSALTAGAPATPGSEGGLAYRDYTTYGVPPLTVVTNENRRIEFMSRGGTENIPQTPVLIEHVVDTLNTAATGYQNNSGAGIGFAVNSTDPGQDARDLGTIGGIKISDDVNAITLFPIDPAQGFNTPLKYAFLSNGEVQIDELGIDGSSATITTNTSNINLTLTANGTGYVDFYGAYQLPRTIGQAGEILKVPTSGTVLEWGTGGGGGTTTAIGGITGATPGVVTTTVAHQLNDGQAVTITDVVGMTALNGNQYYADVLSSTTFALYTDDALTTPFSTAAYPPYVSGGFVTGEVTGGGSSTFVGLSDTPSSYAGAAADADKMLQINAAGNAIEFTAISDIVDDTYIDAQGGLLKAGGTMTGNINLDSNDITNGGTITATSFSGPLTGNVFTSLIDSSDSSAITITPGVVMSSFLEVQNNLDVSDNLNTRNLAVSNNTTLADVTITGTLSVDNFDITGGGTPTFTSGSDIVFDATGQLTTNAPLVPNINNNTTLGTASFKWSNVYATTFTGNLTGNVTGNVSGNLTGTADIATEITATANNSTNETVYLTFVDGATGTQGIETDTALTYNPSSDTLTAGTFNGNLTATTATIGDLSFNGSNIEGTSNGTVRIASQGTGSIELEGNTSLKGTLSYQSYEDLTIGATASTQVIDVTAPITYVKTQGAGGAADWISAGADYAFGSLAAGTYEGQTKIIKMVERGRFSTNGGASFTDRYLEVALTINGASGTLIVSENSEFGAVTLVWHDSSWWVISQFDS